MQAHESLLLPLLQLFHVPAMKVVKQRRPASIGKRKRRSVSFHPQVQVYSSTITLTKDDIQSAWLQPHEKLEIKAHLLETIDLMKAGSIVNERTHCTRGLENYVNFKQHKRSRRKVIHTVLAEQTRQKKWFFEKDPDLIAMASKFSRTLGARI